MDITDLFYTILDYIDDPLDIYSLALCNKNMYNDVKKYYGWKRFCNRLGYKLDNSSYYDVFLEYYNKYGNLDNYEFSIYFEKYPYYNSYCPKKYDGKYIDISTCSLEENFKYYANIYDFILQLIIVKSPHNILHNVCIFRQHIISKDDESFSINENEIKIVEHDLFKDRKKIGNCKYNISLDHDVGSCVIEFPNIVLLKRKLINMILEETKKI